MVDLGNGVTVIIKAPEDVPVLVNELVTPSQVIVPVAGPEGPEGPEGPQGEAGEGGPPSGGAGGVLSGSYPNPGFAVDMAEQSELNTHTSNTSNPHAVTKSQVGLGSVDNTSDAAKPLSTAAIAATDRPSYMPSTVTHNYDPSLNVYNFKPSNTRKLRKGLGKAATSQLAEFVTIGDSGMTGAISSVGPVWDRLRAWPITMRDHSGVPAAGTGMVRITDGAYVDSRWVVTGAGWLTTYLSCAYTPTNGQTAEFTTTHPGDRVTVFYYDLNDASTFTVHVNGILQGTVTQNAGAGWKKVTYSTPIEVGQKVLLTKTGGSFMFLSGAAVWSTLGGLLVHNIAQGGSGSFGAPGVSDPKDSWSDAAHSTSLGVVYAAPTVSLTNPDAVFIGLGGNDMMDGVSVANTKTALTTVRNRYPNSDVVLVATNKLRDGLVAQATWDSFLAGMYELADTLDVPFVDQTARLGTFSVVEANGLHGDADGHLKVEAQVDFGRNVAAIVSSVGHHKRLPDQPTYIPSTAQHLYDPATNTYNMKPANTRKLRRGLGKAATSQICELVALGDSAATGAISDVGPVFDRLRAWPMAMRDNLGLPVAGTGLVRINDAQTIDSRWVLAGTWVHTTLSYSYATVTASTATLTSNLSGDRVTVYYYDDNSGATWRATINGANQATVTNNAGAGWKKITYNVAVAAGQTVVLTYLTGATFAAFSGVNVWKSGGGIIMHNIAQGGALASGTGSASWEDASTALTLGQVYASPTSSLTNPDCVFISIGAMDMQALTTSGTTPTVATVKTALTTIRNRYPNSDAVLIATHKLNDTLITPANWETFLTGLYELADTLDVPLIDQTARLGPYSTILANSLNGDTPGHLKIEAQADLGRNAADVVGNIGDRTLDLATDSITGVLPVLNGGTGSALGPTVGKGSIAAAAQSLTASAANLITGTSIALPTNGLRVGSRFKWELGVIKTAAGAATWQVFVKFGTNNTTADAAIATWTSGTNTTASDQGKLTIEMEVLTLGSGTSATAKCIAIYNNTLTDITGLGRINFVPGSTAGFNSTATLPFLHIDITPGAAAVMTAVGTAAQLAA